MKNIPMNFDQLFQIETCRAASGCPNSNLDAGYLVADLEEIFSRLDFTARLRERLGEEPVLLHHIFRVSVSGCPNACSRPQIADFGLVGQVEPQLNPEACTGCGACVLACPEGAVSLEDDFPSLDREKCLLCGNCIRACTTGAMHPGEKGFAVLVGGRMGRHPRLAYRLADLARRETAVQRLTDLLKQYLESGRPGERFGAFLDRCGIFSEVGG